MERYEYMRIPVKDIPAVIMEQYKLWPLVHNGFVLVEIRRGIYGLPQAGILDNEQLVQHLSIYGYYPTKNTPGLFRHQSRDISFSLVVDDFGYKYVGKEHADHLIAELQALYSITIEWDGTLYCGITFKWNYKER
jgi:hypothetical protein